MALNPASQVGAIIGALANQQQSIVEDSIPDEIEQSVILTPIDTAQVATTVLVYKHFYDPNSFIIDHPVYGELDSSTLLIDGGYLVSDTGAEFPLTFGNNGGLGFAFNEKSVSGKVLWDTYEG